MIDLDGHRDEGVANVGSRVLEDSALRSHDHVLGIKVAVSACIALRDGVCGRVQIGAVVISRNLSVPSEAELLFPHGNCGWLRLVVEAGGVDWFGVIRDSVGLILC